MNLLHVCVVEEVYMEIDELTMNPEPVPVARPKVPKRQELRIFVDEDLPESHTERRSCFVEVTGFSEDVTQDDLILLFEHRKSGGGDVESIKVDKNKRRAIIQFQDADG